MSNTIQPDIQPNSYGGSFTALAPKSVATSGFTARTLTSSYQGMITTSKMELLNGFTPADNSSTQKLTFPLLSISENSSDGVLMSVHPATAGTTPSLYRENNSTGQSLESMNYDATANGVGTGFDRTTYTFSQTRLGNKYLRLGGTISAYQTKAYILNANGTTGSPTTYGANSGLNGGSVSSANTNTDYGHWPVTVTIQALLVSYEKFVLKAGSPVLADDVLQDMNDKQVKFSEMIGIADINGNFVNDFVVDPALYQIVKQFSTNDISFHSGSAIPEGTTISVGNYVPGAISGTFTSAVDLSSTSNGQPNYFMQYYYANYPTYQFKLSPGTVVDVAFTILDGYSVPSGMIAESGSTTDFVDGTIITSPLVLTNVRAEAGFQVPGDPSNPNNQTVLTGLITEGKRAKYPKGMSSSLYQPALVGLSTKEPLDLNGIEFPAGSSLESDMTIVDTYELPVSLSTHRGTKLSKGTYIPKGSKTLGGATIEGELLIDRGSTVTSDFEVSSPFIIEASASGSNSLQSGTLIKGPFEFPVGTQLTSGNVLPAALKIITAMGVTLDSGMKLLTGTIFGSSFCLYGDVGFDPSAIIPALSTLYGTFTLPRGTKLEKEFNINVPLPIPDRTKFHSGDKIPIGTVFREGGSLPPISDISEQAGTAWTSGNPVGPLTKFTDTTVGETYIVVKANTALLPGFIIPSGSYLSTQSTPGTTGSLKLATGGTYNTTFDLQAGSFSRDNSVRGPSESDIVITPGTPTDAMIVMLTDVVFPTDLLVPLSEIDPESGKYLSLNESFTLIQDLILPSDFTVRGPNTALWPGNYPIPTDFVFSSSYTFTASGSGSSISKKIQLNVSTTSEFVNGVMGSSSHIRYPAAGYKLETPVKLGVNQPVANAGSNATKSTIELVSGTEILTTAPITLILPMKSTNDFTVEADLTDFPRIFAPSGLKLLAGQTTPGDIHVTNGSPLPKNVTLNQGVTLSADHLICEDDYTLQPYTVLGSGSVLKRLTSFTNGLRISGKVTLGPILSLQSSDVFYFMEDSTFNTTLYYPLLFDSSVNKVKGLAVDVRDALVHLEQLKQQIELLEMQVVRP